MGNKLLSTPSTPILTKDLTNQSANINLLQIIQDMKDTMKEKGGVGIAAPQIGYNKRIIMFGFEKNIRYPQEKPVPFTIIVNPNIKILFDRIVDLTFRSKK